MNYCYALKTHVRCLKKIPITFLYLKYQLLHALKITNHFILPKLPITFRCWRKLLTTFPFSRKLQVTSFFLRILQITFRYWIKITNYFSLLNKITNYLPHFEKKYQLLFST